MKKLGSKALSIVMSIVLVVGLCPGLAYAGEGVEDAAQEPDTLMVASSGDFSCDGSAVMKAQAEMIAQANMAEQEPNDTYGAATKIAINDTISASISKSSAYVGAHNSEDATGDQDFYEVDIPTSGTFSLTCTNKDQATYVLAYLRVYVMNSYREEVGSLDVDLKSLRPNSCKLNLPAGSYYFRVVAYRYESGYTLSISRDNTNASNSSSNNSAASQVMHRLYNPNSGEHFYTASAAERDAVVRAGWKYEGVGWTAPATSATPVFRLYNANGGEHHYTTSAAERDMLVRAGWKSEGVGWHSDDAKSVPLYREYNPNAFANNHNYTTSKAEHDWLISLGWKDEGRAWYGV